MTNLNREISTKQSNYFDILFSELEDPRRTTSGHYYYPLDEIVFLTITSVLSGFESWSLIQLFGEEKINWLRKYFPFKEGIPSEFVLKNVFAKLDTNCFNACFINWINTIAKLTQGEVVAIDGKTIRGSGKAGVKHSAFHIVSAYATENRLCLGQKVVHKKQNEIIAIPELLELLVLKGCIVTADAMACQKAVAKKIIEADADYILMVKDNQQELASQVTKIFNLQKNNPKIEKTDFGHNRIETRICEVTDNLTFLDDKELWSGLRSVVKITSYRHDKQSDKSSCEIRYYITSLAPNPVKISEAIRSHWAIENNLHWNLDVVFNEDKSLKKKDNSPANFNIVRKVALALLEKEKTQKGSKNTKKGKAAINDDYRSKLLKGLEK